MRRSIWLAALFLLAIGPPLFAEIPKILKVSEIQSSTKAVGFSVFRGVESQRFEVELRGVTDAGGFNLILSSVSGGPMETPLERIGAIGGMSGSPVFVGCANGPIRELPLDDCIKNGTLVGALSYGVGYFISSGTNALLTPAEYMLGANLGGYPLMRQFAIRPPDKINISGVEFINLMLFPRAELLSAQSGSSGNVCNESVSGELKPGSMVTVFLARGSRDVAGSGTVTWIDGDKIYIFGHPIFGTGMINYPFKHVSVADTLQTPFQASKITGCYLKTSGTMLVDGMFELAGIIGRNARLLPLRVEVHVGDNFAVFYEEIAESPLAPIIIGQLPVVWAKEFLGDTRSVSVAYQAHISITDNPEIFLKNLIPAHVVEDPFSDVFSKVVGALERLKGSGFGYNPESIKVHIDLVREMAFWKVKKSFLSQSIAKPGDTVHINIVFEEFSSRALKQISIPVQIPGDFYDRTAPNAPSQVSVTIQSANKFKNKSNPQDIVSLENLIREINESANLKTNILYIQQILPIAKDKRDVADSSAKSSTSPSWSWTELDQGGLLRLPSNRKEEITLSITPELNHFLDFDATFTIPVQPDKNTVGQSAETSKKAKKKKWYLLYLL